MGDMLYDEEIGSKVTQLAGSFSGLTLVGDPGKVTFILYVFLTPQKFCNKFLVRPNGSCNEQDSCIQFV